MSTTGVTAPPTAAELDQLAVNTIRTLSIDAVERAKSGHPGTPMALAPLVYTIWNRVMRFDPEDPIWPNRDRFVLSNGHASMLLWSVLHLTGTKAVNADYERLGQPSVSLDDIRHFRQIDSKAPGHPEYQWVSGVETTTGPLGQGAATSVGMAIAEKWLADRYNRPGFAMFAYDIYVVCGDGCLMEGVTSEAASLAGHLGLDNLCWVYDNNHITIEGQTSLAFTEDVATRFLGYGWNVLRVGDANDLDRIEQALARFRETKARPTLLILDSHIGYGAPHKHDSAAAHGEPLGDEEVRLAKRSYGWPEDRVVRGVPGKVSRPRDRDRADAAARSAGGVGPGSSRLSGGCEGDRRAGRLRQGVERARSERPVVSRWIGRSRALEQDRPDVQRRIQLSGRQPGRQDAALRDSGARAGDDRERPRAVEAAAIRGDVLHLQRLCAARDTALVADGLPTIFVFTHDAMGDGEDGPTHQPVEHLASLRAMPGLVTVRPGDANEVVEAYRYVIQLRHQPAVLALSRQPLPTLDRHIYAPATGVARGAYVLADAPGGNPEVILIASGSEVGLAVEAHGKLVAEGIRARVVSMPSWEIFEQQTQAYRDTVLPPAVKARLAIEQASTFGWERYVGGSGRVIGMKTFGASASLKALQQRFGYEPDRVVAAAKAANTK